MSDFITNNLTVVLGAGASMDCVAEGEISEFDQEWRPPLTADLFAPRAHFNRILQKYPKVGAVSESIRIRLRNNENLEDILQSLEASQNLQVKKQIWEVVFYLQELLWTVSDQFIRSGGTKFDTLVQRVLTSRFDRVLFLTLNYDLLLDSALVRFDDHSFISPEDYIPRKKKWFLVKAHGSVNWGHPILDAPLGASDPDFVVRSVSQIPNTDGLIRVMQGNRGLAGFSDGARMSANSLLFPALAIPARRQKSFVCPQEHIEEAREYFRQCENYLFIGFSGLDEHVLDLFRDVPKVYKLSVVNGSKDAGKGMFGRLRERNGLMLPSWATEEKLIFAGGFRAFMEGPGLEQFLTDRV